jgi:putative membrane protein
MGISRKARSRVARLTSGSLFSLVLGAALVTANANAAQSVGDIRPTVGLVNEDLAAAFNGESYTFGTSFVDRISKDSEYNWVVLSRSVAQKAYDDGSVDAVLYIPQSFTRDILTLQELVPTKATVEYKLEPQEDERADQLLEGKIVGIVHGFNESVIKMYYASLADSVTEADGYMHASLLAQAALIEALTADVQEPLSGTVPSIENFMSGASGLKEVNTATVEAQNMLTDSVTESLAATGDALTSQLPQIDHYTAQQREIAQINVNNSNKGIAEQANSDLGFYDAQFAALRTAMFCALVGTDAAGASVPCALPDGTVPPHLAGRTDELRQAIAQQSTSQGQAVAALFAEMDSRIRNLRAIETLLLTAAAEPVDPNAPVDPSDPVDASSPVDPAIIANLQSEILALESTRDSLSARLSSPDVGAALANLDTWSADTLAKLEQSSLAASAVSSLAIDDWSAYSPDGSGLYVDSSDALHTGITGLIDQAEQTTSQIAGSAATVPDNSAQFDALLQEATSTFDGAEHVFAELNELVSTGTTGLEDNSGYYENFATLLVNTRTPGVDTGTIYDFFAAPVSTKNITPERAASASVTDPAAWFEPEWAAVFGGGLLVGAVATFAGNALRKRNS